MTIQVVDQERLRELCERYGIASLEVFGSVARGDAGPDSDIDLLFSLKPGVRLGWEIEDLTEGLRLIHRGVLISPNYRFAPSGA